MIAMHRNRHTGGLMCIGLMIRPYTSGTPHAWRPVLPEAHPWAWRQRARAHGIIGPTRPAATIRTAGSCLTRNPGRQPGHTGRRAGAAPSCRSAGRRTHRPAPRRILPAGRGRHRVPFPDLFPGLAPWARSRLRVA
jgi:hypothetical protein